MPKDIPTTSQITGAAKDSDLQITLEPIRSDGPAALVTKQIPQIKDVALREIEVAYEDPHHAVTIARADNLFLYHRASGNSCSPIPSTGKLTRAILAFLIDGFNLPQLVELSPPHKIHFHCVAVAPLVLAWLEASPFRAVQKLAATAVVFLLALAAATAPLLDDNDGDADDDDGASDRHTLRLTA